MKQKLDFVGLIKKKNSSSHHCVENCRLSLWKAGVPVAGRVGGVLVQNVPQLPQAVTSPAFESQNPFLSRHPAVSNGFHLVSQV